MRPSARRVVTLLVAVCAVVAAGCSNGSTSSSENPTNATSAPPESSTQVPGSVPSFLPETLDHNDYVERVKQICTTPELGGDIGGEVNVTSASEDVDAAYGAIETRLDLMRQMPVPDADQQAWAAVENAYDRYLTALSDLSDARSVDDSTQSEQLATELDGLRSDVESAVDALGIDDCTV